MTSRRTTDLVLSALCGALVGVLTLVGAPGAALAGPASTTTTARAVTLPDLYLLVGPTAYEPIVYGSYCVACSDPSFSASNPLLRVIDDGGTDAVVSVQGLSLQIVPARDQSGWFAVRFAVVDRVSNQELGRATAYVDVAPLAPVVLARHRIETVVGDTARAFLKFDDQGLGPGDGYRVAADASPLGVLSAFEALGVAFEARAVGTDTVTVTVVDAGGVPLGTSELDIVVRPAPDVTLRPDEITVATGDVVRPDVLANDDGLPVGATFRLSGPGTSTGLVGFDARGLTPGDYHLTYVTGSYDPVPLVVHVVAATDVVARDTLLYSHNSRWSPDAYVDLVSDISAGASVRIIDGPHHGSFALYRGRAAGGYTPDVSFTGSDTMSYIATDSEGHQDAATVYIEVLPRGLDLGLARTRISATSVMISDWDPLNTPATGIALSAAPDTTGWSGPPPAGLSLVPVVTRVATTASNARVAGLTTGVPYRLCLDQLTGPVRPDGQQPHVCGTYTPQYVPRFVVGDLPIGVIPASVPVELPVDVSGARGGATVFLEQKVDRQDFTVVDQQLVPASGAGRIVMQLVPPAGGGHFYYRFRAEGDVTQKGTDTDAFGLRFYRLTLGEVVGGKAPVVTLTNPGDFTAGLDGLVVDPPSGPSWPLSGGLLRRHELRVHPGTGRGGPHDVYVGDRYRLARHGAVVIRTSTGAVVASRRY